jgi:hypothetical protein
MATSCSLQPGCSRISAINISPRPSQSLWACHPNSRNSSKSFHRPLRILYNAMYGHRADSLLFTERHHSRAVARGRLDRIVRFRWRIHKYSTSARDRIDQRIARRFFDDNIDPHWSILSQPSILNHRYNHLHRRHRRALRLHRLRPTDDPQRIWLTPCTSKLNAFQPLFIHRSRMGRDVGVASLPSEMDEPECGEVLGAGSDWVCGWDRCIRNILFNCIEEIRPERQCLS